jgi:alpha-L-rhamnosidase
MKTPYPFFFAVILLFTSCALQNDIRIVNKTCEYLTNPIGIDNTNPRLSWILQSNQNGQKQTAYHILAASSLELLKKNSGDLWDTGKVDSDQSVHIVYDGSTLDSQHKIFWKVKVWDKNGQPSNWSDTSFWEMGLLQQKNWQAQWIGSPDETDTFSNAPLFRKEFPTTKEIKTARAYVSGLGYYELYVNGNKVGDHVLSPNQTNYDRRQNEDWREQRIGNMATRTLYETFDITKFLTNGENAVGVWLGAGWYRQNDRLENRTLWNDSPRFICQIEIEYADGRKETILSDGSWKTSKSPILHNGLHTGEIYDARLEQDGWNRSNFDDSSWKKTIVVRPPDGQLKAQMSPPDRVIKTIKPVSVKKLENDIYRFDLGQMISGWAQLKINGSVGTKINLKFIEELGPTYGQNDTYILNGNGPETWEPRFTWHAFRYVDVSGAPFPLTLENLKGRVVNTDVDTVGYFECSNNLFNRMLKNYRWTQLGNMHGGIPSDCPHRERRGYTGDGQISAQAAIYNFDMSSFYTKWLNDIADAQNSKTGYVPNTTPYQDGGGGTAWGSAFVIIPWAMYLNYGDEQILREHYAGMKKWVHYLDLQRNKTGVLENQGLGEWVPPGLVDLPPAFVNSCYLYYNCDLMAKIANILKFDSDKIYYEKLGKKVRNAVYENYYNESNFTFSTGTQGANVFPLGFGMVSESQKANVLRQLTTHIKTKNNGHFDTGILATPLQLDVLSENGFHELAYTLMNQQDYPGFGYMINKGATTIWETWGGDASHSHPMFGSVCQWLYQKLAGINPDEKAPGYKNILVKPQPVAGLSFAKASYFSPYGEIKSSWKIIGDKFKLDVQIPVNATATVFVPAISQSLVKVNGKNVDQFVHFQKMEGTSAVFKVESGTYQFISKNILDIFPRPMLSAPTITPKDTLVFKPDSVLVQISSDINNTEIYYTLDNSGPSQQNKKYETPFYINQNSTIKARCFKPGYGPGFTTSSIINFVEPKTNGLQYKYYEGEWRQVPNMHALKPVSNGTVYNFGLEHIHFNAEEFALQFTGFIKIEKAGEYIFYSRTNDGSLLYVNHKLVVNNDGPHGPDERQGEIYLKPGLLPIKLEYFQAGGGMFLEVYYKSPDIEKQQIPPFLLYQKKN